MENPLNYVHLVPRFDFVHEIYNRNRSGRKTGTLKLQPQDVVAKRLKCGLSQSKLAQLVNCKEKDIKNIELGINVSRNVSKSVQTYFEKMDSAPSVRKSNEPAERKNC